ncbi:MAG: HAD-IC family P-type ATPase [Patescibacteria group bacterium]|jgi:Ca2+-transporting ATPase
MPNQGLSSSEVIKIQEKIGKNVLPAEKKFSWFSILFNQFKSPIIYVFFVVIGVSVYFKEYAEVYLIGAVILLDIIMGFIQEFKAQKTLEELKKILKPRAVVIRDSENKNIDVAEIVPGDLVVLNSGDKIPSDGYLIEGINLLINEAILTGEEEAVEKNTNEKTRKLFMGTTVIYGHGIMKVTSIGRQTEIGKIGKSLSEIKDTKTPLQIKLEKFTRSLIFIIIIVCAIIFVVGVLNHQDIGQMLQISIILSVAAIPEGLPVVITVILAIGMRRVLKKKGLVKNLLSIETLGSTSVICTDKTGTLTEGNMKVAKTWFLEEEKANLAMILDNNQRSNLEIALWNYLKDEKKISPQEIFNKYKRIYEEPFDSEKKYSMSVNDIEGKEMALLMGAPEIVLSFCSLTSEETKNILEKIDEFAESGLRILGIVGKENGDLKKTNDFKWLGLIGVSDPIRPEVKDVIKKAQEAGIKVKIVTGDFRKTAERVALNLGFEINDDNVLEGKDLEKMSEEELKKIIEKIVLFSRVTPHQKLKIVQALQDNGEVVAMTGDGVNDAPALKKADIGVAVGSATEVAKEAADLILLDNNFKTIVAACEEGRLIFANMKKVIGYALSNSFVEIVFIFGAMMLGLPAPLLIVQILWVHLICDGPPDIILSFEPKEPGLMQEDPKKLKAEQILNNWMKFLMLTISLGVGSLVLFLFWYYNKTTGDIDLARTIAFATVASVDLIYIFSYKDLRHSIFKMHNFFANKWLFWGVGYGFVLLCAAIYIPGLNNALHVEPMHFWEWGLVLGIGFLAMAWVEIVKWVSNRRGTSN